MSKVVCWLLISLSGLTQFAQGGWPQTRTLLTSRIQPKDVPLPLSTAPQYSRLLHFNVYSFSIVAPDSGRLRDIVIKAYRGESLLTNFQIRVDGALVGAVVSDLDQNRLPELYLFSTSDGSGSFGRVYGWQFLPDRKVAITTTNWQVPPTEGYMGHDSLWIDRAILCRRYPIYKPGDANAQPTGGYQTKRYHLRTVGNTYALVAE